MDQLRQVLLLLLAVAMVVSLAALAAALYEFRTGRLLRIPFRRKVPATEEDIRKNGLALVLNDLAVLLIDLIVLPSLLLQEIRFSPLVAISYFATGGAGFTAALLLTLTSLHVRGEVRYQVRRRSGSVPSAEA